MLQRLVASLGSGASTGEPAHGGCSILTRQRAAFVYLDDCSPFLLVKSGSCFDLGPPPQGMVTPGKPDHRSTWLILNGSYKEMCLFISTEPVPLVYRSHGSNHLLNKQHQWSPSEQPEVPEAVAALCSDDCRLAWWGCWDGMA